MAKINETTPSAISLCIILTNDHARGVLLYRIRHWTKYARISLPGADGYWIANPRLFWQLEAQLSTSQCDRAFSWLEKEGLIERRQFWFWQPEHLARSVDCESFRLFRGCQILASRRRLFSWDLMEADKFADVGSTKLSHSNEMLKNAKVSTADMKNSNYIENFHKNKHDDLQCAPATPVTWEPKASSEKQISGEGKGLKVIDPKSSMIKEAMEKGVTSLNELVTTWTLTTQHCSGWSSPPTAKEKGYLAEIFCGLTHVWGPLGKEDFRCRAHDILIFGIVNWTKIGLGKAPTKP